MARKRVKPKKGDTVKIHYTCKLEDGTVADSSNGIDPIEFTLGKRDVIKGLEEAVMGMKVGQSKTVNIPPGKAYGLRHEDWALEVPRNKMPEGIKAEAGVCIEIPGEDGSSSTATVTHISGSSVTLDFNHPLAGKELIFDISLLEIV
jgi:peptidylprolyl isomerase